MKVSFAFSVVALILLTGLARAEGPATQPTTLPAERVDLLDLANGAVVLSKSSEYGGTQWSALALLDGTPTLGWCSAKDKALPHEVLIELARPTALDTIVFDQTKVEESGYPGISVKAVEVWASNVSSTEGFTKILQAELPKGGRQELKLPAPVPARWLKFVIRSNWGDPHYTELMELDSFGQALPGAVVQAPLSGIFATNYGLLRVEQSGSSVHGCYDHDGGVLTGTTDGRVVSFEWRENEGTQIGTAMMILSSKGDSLNGFWYENGALAGNWYGERARPGEQPACKVAGGGANAIATNLSQSGRVVTYGILFDTASDKIKPESESTLNEVLGALQGQPALALEIQGHTDSQGDDAYNRDLSQRRAQSVVTYLTGKGVTAARLSAKGFGKTQPVADNATAQGRTLNRRVELVKK